MDTTLTLSAPPTFAADLAAADRNAAAAHHLAARQHLIDVARLVRAVFPTAEQVVIDTEEVGSFPSMVRLAGILDHSGAVLWTPNQHGGVADAFVTADHCHWSAVVHRIEDALTTVLGAADPGDVWDDAADLATALAPRRLIPAELWRERLPSAAEVDAVLRTAPPPTAEQRQKADFYNRSAELVPASEDGPPALRVADVLIFGYVDRNRAQPTLRVSVDLDEVADDLRTLPGEAVAMEIRVQGDLVFSALG